MFCCLSGTISLSPLHLQHVALSLPGCTKLSDGAAPVCYKLTAVKPRIKKAAGRNLWPPLHKTFHQQLCKSIAPPKMEVNNNLFRVCSSAPLPTLTPSTPIPLLSSVLAHPSSPCSVWALEVVSRGLCPVHWS